jgi:hypothetical protein
METTETKTSGTAITGAALGGSALLLSVLNGGLGNLLGGMRAPAGDPPWSRDLRYERDLTEKDAKIGKLEAQIYTDQQVQAAERRFEDKLDAIEKQLNASVAAQAVLNAKQEAFIGGIAAQVASFDRMTARYIAGPVMTASEAVASAFSAKTATAPASSGN